MRNFLFLLPSSVVFTAPPKLGAEAVPVLFVQPLPEPLKPLVAKVRLAHKLAPVVIELGHIDPLRIGVFKHPPLQSPEDIREPSRLQLGERDAVGHGKRYFKHFLLLPQNPEVRVRHSGAMNSTDPPAPCRRGGKNWQATHAK